MTFEVGKFYRHASTLDIDIYVTQLFRNRLGMQVKYFNRHYKIWQGREEFVLTPPTGLWKEVSYED